MAISKKQTEALLAFVASSKPDQLDCDGCFDQMSEFVEHELTNREIPEALQAVKTHLDQCACCNDEHSALLDALHALEEADS